MQAMDYKRPESVLVVVYTLQGETLLLRRLLPPVGIWQSVTGSLGWQEEAGQAAQRELLEETGLSGEPQATGQDNRYQIVPEALHLYPPGVTQNTETVFEMCLPERVDISLNPDEHSEYCWVSLAEAEERVWSWSNRIAIEHLRRHNPRFQQASSAS